MTPDERALIEDLFKRLQAADAAPKDAEAADLISRGVANVPGAPYLLVQLALLQEHALKNAAAHIADLERQSATGAVGGNAAQSGGSFLGLASAAAPADPWAAGAAQRPAVSAGPWGTSQAGASAPALCPRRLCAPSGTSLLPAAARQRLSRQRAFNDGRGGCRIAAV